MGTMTTNELSQDAEQVFEKLSAPVSQGNNRYKLQFLLPDDGFPHDIEQATSIFNDSFPQLCATPVTPHDHHMMGVNVAPRSALSLRLRELAQKLIG